MPNPPKTYTEEFKREAVRLATERGNIAQTARDLGVSDTSILYWKKQLQEVPNNPFPGQGNPRDAELAQLQREVARLKEENDMPGSRIVSPRPSPLRTGRTPHTVSGSSKSAPSETLRACRCL